MILHMASTHARSRLCVSGNRWDVNQRSSRILYLARRLMRVNIVDELVRRLSKKNFKGHTLTLKVKFSDFSQITRSVTEPRAIPGGDSILEVARRLTSMPGILEKPVRLLGLTMSNSHDDEPSDPYTVQLRLDI